jgi:FtsP/CotA-like multicopper oxidase with cupredoxin domain
MMQKGKINRGDFLRLSGLGITALFASSGGLSAFLKGWSSTKQALAVSPANTGLSSNPAAELEIALKATRGEVSILPGKATRVWTYQGQMLKGDPASLQAMPGSYLGPIVRVRKGQKVRIHFTNLDFHDTNSPKPQERLRGHCKW